MTDNFENLITAIMKRYNFSRDRATEEAHRHVDWIIENIQQGRCMILLTPEEWAQCKEIEPGVYEVPQDLVDQLLDPRRDEVQAALAKVIVRRNKDQ